MAAKERRQKRIEQGADPVVRDRLDDRVLDGRLALRQVRRRRQVLGEEEPADQEAAEDHHQDGGHEPPMGLASLEAQFLRRQVRLGAKAFEVLDLAVAHDHAEAEEHDEGS